MPGGMIFTVDNVPIWTPEGNLLACPSCGRHGFDVTLRGGGLDRIECAAADCGRPVTAEDYPASETAGR